MLLYLITLLDDPNDEPLVREMYNMYNIFLTKYAHTLLHNWDDAEDATQNAWIRVVLSFATAKACYYKSHNDFKMWAAVIVKNLATDELRKRKRAPEPLENWDAPTPDTSEDSAEANDALKMFYKLLNALSVKDRLAVQMHEGGMYSFKEIGKRLGCSEAAAQRRCSRAMKEMRKKITEAGY